MSRFQRSVIFGAVLLVSASVAGAVYASGAYAHPAAATKSLKVVEVSGKYAFKAKNITVSAGTKVIWKNTTDAAHTVTTTGHPPATFNRQLATGKAVSVTFSKKGTYHYFCAIHPYMKGTVVVK